MTAISSKISSFPDQLKGHMEFLASCQANVLFDKVQDKFSFQISSETPRACWQPDTRRILINPKVLQEESFDDQIALLIFETYNAIHFPDPKKMLSNLETMKRGKFVKSLAKREYKTLSKASRVVQHLIRKGKLKEGTLYQEGFFRDFESHFRFQALSGDLDHMASLWDTAHQKKPCPAPRIWDVKLDDTLKYHLTHLLTYLIYQDNLQLDGYLRGLCKVTDGETVLKSYRWFVETSGAGG